VDGLLVGWVSEINGMPTIVVVTRLLHHTIEKCLEGAIFIATICQMKLGVIAAVENVVISRH